VVEIMKTLKERYKRTVERKIREKEPMIFDEEKGIINAETKEVIVDIMHIYDDFETSTVSEKEDDGIKKDENLNEKNEIKISKEENSEKKDEDNKQILLEHNKSNNKKSEDIKCNKSEEEDYEEGEVLDEEEEEKDEEIVINTSKK
jgi:hypothetical protein